MADTREAVCTGCGGRLIPDAEYNIYRCTSCGVAFGSSVLFDPDSAAKAAASMRDGEFTEADIRYNCILMTDPKNFEALKGRVLCAAKWRRAGEITDGAAFTPVRMENVRKRISEAIENAEDDRKEFFRKFDRLFNLLEKMQDKDEATKPDEVTVSKLHKQFATLRKELVIMANKAGGSDAADEEEE